MRAGDRIIRVSTTAVVLGVAAVAAFTSYRHCVEVIDRWGAESALSARLIPATIDGLVFASSMTMLWAHRYRLAVPGLARWSLAAGILATLTANCLHGLSEGIPGAVIGAWPAGALVMSYELLMWIVKSGRELADLGQPSPGLSYEAAKISQSPETWLTDVRQHSPAEAYQPHKPHEDRRTRLTDVPVSDRDQTPPLSVPDTTPIYDAVRSDHSVMSAPESDVSRIRPEPNTSPRRVSSLDMSDDRTAIVAAMLLKNPDLKGSDVGRRFGVTERQGLRILRRAQASMNGKPIGAP